MATGVRDAKQAAHDAHDSTTVEGLARYGFAGRGAVYLVIGLLAMQVARGRPGEDADHHGAFSAIKDQPLGGPLLALLGLSFAAYASWRLLEGLVGHREADGARRTAKRLHSLGRVVAYGTMAFTTVRFLLEDESKDRTRAHAGTLMEASWGRVAVCAIGAAVAVAGLYMAYRGLVGKCLKKLDLHKASATVRAVAGPIGLVGLTSRGLAYALMGAFLVRAAVTFDPDDAKGLDAALKALLEAPYGRPLLALTAVGLVTFGLWSFLEARYRRV